LSSSYSTGLDRDRFDSLCDHKVFLPHLFHTLCVRGLNAEVGFDSPRRFPDRKHAAREAWRQVHLLRTANEL
jgi:hypothetical protein